MLRGLFCFSTCILKPELDFKPIWNVFPGIKHWPLLLFDNTFWDVVILCVIDRQFKRAILWFKEAKEGSGGKCEGKCSNLRSYQLGR